jgi:hypothetical protein
LAEQLSGGSHTGEVLVVGVSRSGTTVVADILRAAQGAHVEMEPHLIWKAGDFEHLDDEDHPREESAYEWIRARLTRECAGKTLIEKSPPNCLRPQTVHRVFPDARILYVLRDPLACLYSNYKKSTGKQALSPRIALRKYLLPTDKDSQHTSFGSDRMATGGRPLWSQLRLRDARRFAGYSADLWRFRWRTGSLPFGPKLSGFEEIVRDVGLIGYHARCMMVAIERAMTFRELYGEMMRVVMLEELVAHPDAVVPAILDFAQCELPPRELARVVNGLGERAETPPLGASAAHIERTLPARWSTEIAAHTDRLRQR